MKFINGLGGLLARGGSQYFADGRLTEADLKVLVQIRALGKGVLDHIPTDAVEGLSPPLAEHRDRVANDPRILAS